MKQTNHSLSNEQQSNLDVLLNQSLKRNNLAAVSWEIIWSIGSPSCLIAAMVPLYLFTLGVTKTTVQFVMLLFAIMTFLQILGPRIIGGTGRKFKTYLMYAIFTFSWMFYSLAALVAWNFFSRNVWIFLFVFHCLILAITNNLGFPVYNEMILENTPLKKRGNLASMRSIAVGSFGLIGMLLTRWLMKQKPSPVNYHYAFLIGGTIMFLSCLAVLGIKDNAQTVYDSHKIKPPAPVKAAKILLKNFNFRGFLFFYILSISAQSLAPLIIGYGKEILEMNPADAVLFSGVYFIGPIIAGVCMKSLADRYGFRLIGIVSAFLLGTTFILPLLSPHSRLALLAGYALYAATVTMNAHVLANLGFETVSEIKPSVIIAVGSIIALPPVFLLSPFGGWLADRYAAAGYQAVFAMGATLCFCTLLGFLTLIREPRTGHEIYIRIREM
jgi:MFS family permease